MSRINLYSLRIFLKENGLLLHLTVNRGNVLMFVNTSGSLLMGNFMTLRVNYLVIRATLYTNRIYLHDVRFTRRVNLIRFYSSLSLLCLKIMIRVRLISSATRLYARNCENRHLSNAHDNCTILRNFRHRFFLLRIGVFFLFSTQRHPYHRNGSCCRRSDGPSFTGSRLFRFLWSSWFSSGWWAKRLGVSFLVRLRRVSIRSNRMFYLGLILLHLRRIVLSYS